uniref:Uncharacterized protein n=1 Tax=Physcomitrium patens TaxID=3218 RepID=A0A2K1L8D3_PHYPA|nr:hypothetical protein PHYPA_000723 [Physcomitrium patens]
MGGLLQNILSLESRLVEWDRRHAKSYREYYKESSASSERIKVSITKKKKKKKKNKEINNSKEI